MKGPLEMAKFLVKAMSGWEKLDQVSFIDNACHLGASTWAFCTIA
jgi:hypothetical protein